MGKKKNNMDELTNEWFGCAPGTRRHSGVKNAWFELRAVGKDRLGDSMYRWIRLADEELTAEESEVVCNNELLDLCDSADYVGAGRQLSGSNQNSEPSGTSLPRRSTRKPRRKTWRRNGRRASAVERALSAIRTARARQSV